MPLAVETPQRIRALPNVPTVAELGFPGYQAAGWYGMVAPAGTPAELVHKYNASMVKALRSTEVEGLFRDMMMETVTNTPEEFGRFMQSELAHYQEVVRLSGATVS